MVWISGRSCVLWNPTCLEGNGCFLYIFCFSLIFAAYCSSVMNDDDRDIARRVHKTEDPPSTNTNTTSKLQPMRFRSKFAGTTSSDFIIPLHQLNSFSITFLYSLSTGRNARIIIRVYFFSICNTLIAYNTARRSALRTFLLGCSTLQFDVHIHSFSQLHEPSHNAQARWSRPNHVGSRELPYLPKEESGGEIDALR